MTEKALTLPLDVVERLLAMAMGLEHYWTEADREVIKIVDREIEQVRQMTERKD